MCQASLASADGNPALTALLLCFLMKVLSAIRVLSMSPVFQV